MLRRSSLLGLRFRSVAQGVRRGRVDDADRPVGHALEADGVLAHTQIGAGDLQDVALGDAADVPDARGAVSGSGDDARPIGAEGGGIDRSLVAAEDGDRLAGRSVPDACGLIRRCCDDPRPVGAEAGVRDPTLVAAEDADRGAGRGVPDARGAVPRRGDDARPVGAEGGVRDPTLVAAEDADRGAGRGVPDARGLIRRCCDDARPVGPEGGGIDRSLVVAEDADRVPVAASQTRAVLSEDAVTMRDPSGLKAAYVIPPSWPLRTPIAVPVAASQTRAVLSEDAVTMRDPSGLKAAELTAASWPLRTAIALPVAASQTRAVLSSDAVTMRDPSGLKAAEYTPFSWPPRTAIALPVAASQTRAVLSEDAVTMRDPSGLKAADLHPIFVAARLAIACAGDGVPDARGARPRRGDDARPVGAEGGGIDLSPRGRAGWRSLRRSRRPRRARSCHHDAVTMRDPSGLKAADMTQVLVAAQDGDLLAGRGVPDARGLVRRRRDDARPVGAEGGGRDTALVAAEDARSRLPVAASQTRAVLSQTP